MKAVTTAPGCVEMVTCYSDEESSSIEDEHEHPLAEHFFWKEQDGLQRAYELEVIEEENEELDEEVCEVRDVKKMNGLAMDWGLDDVFEEVEKAFGQVVVGGEGQDDVCGKEVIVEDGEDEEDWKCFL